jgi:hypothetical protein
MTKRGADGNVRASFVRGRIAEADACQFVNRSRGKLVADNVTHQVVFVPVAPRAK